MAVKMMNVLCVMIACMVVFAPHSEAAITCGQVVTNMMPCLTFLMSGGAVPPACCDGVKDLNAAAQSTPDRKTACGCLKSAYAAYPGIDGKNAVGLPGKCGVRIPYKISPSTDCSKVV